MIAARTSYVRIPHVAPRSSTCCHRTAAMSLRPFTTAWPDADVAPWVPPATAGIALLLGTCATLLLAHGRAAQLRFNVRALQQRRTVRFSQRALTRRAPAFGRRRRQGWLLLRLRRRALWRWRTPGASARCRRCRRARSRSSRRERCAMHLHYSHAGRLCLNCVAVADARSRAFASQLPGLAACAVALAAFATLALLLLTAPTRVTRGGASKSKRAPPPAPASPRGGRRGAAASDSFTFGAATDATAAATPKLGGRAPAVEAATAECEKPAARATFASRSPDPRPADEPRAPAASPVTSPTRGRPSTAKKSASLLCAHALPARTAAAAVEAPNVALR